MCLIERYDLYMEFTEDGRCYTAALEAHVLADACKLAFYVPMHAQTVRNRSYASKHATILALPPLFY